MGWGVGVQEESVFHPPNCNIEPPNIGIIPCCARIKVGPKGCDLMGGERANERERKVQNRKNVEKVSQEKTFDFRLSCTF